jgi:site-specific DNA-methyltransferase (adenine-specific)
MKTMSKNSIDTIITDPPYGLEFMGKDWDKFGVSKGRAKRLLGVDSEGTGDRFFDHREEAAKRGRYSEMTVNEKSAFQEFIYQTSIELLRVAKPGATLLTFGGTRTYHRLACAIEDAGWILKDCIMWLYGSGFPKATDISKQLDKIAGVKRNREKRFVGNIKGASLHTKPDNSRVWEMVQTNEPITEQAKFWNGWKSHGLKPAYEPILVAIKPNEGSYAQNALKHGVAGLNIDGGRIDLKGIEKHKTPAKWKKGMYDGGWYGGKSGTTRYSEQGRFPSNIILDEKAAKMLDEQSGTLKSGKNCKRKKPHQTNAMAGTLNTLDKEEISYGDKGGASRFFYCAKASKGERNKGCERLEIKQTVGGGGGIGDYKDDVNSMSGKYGSEKAPAKNNHPTVKPLKLMEYLCTLTKTPTGGIVFDPFAGSGTTGMACVNTGRQFILVEKEKEYCKIAAKRIKSETAQGRLF